MPCRKYSNSNIRRNLLIKSITHDEPLRKIPIHPEFQRLFSHQCSCVSLGADPPMSQPSWSNNLTVAARQPVRRVPSTVVQVMSTNREKGEHQLAPRVKADKISPGSSAVGKSKKRHTVLAACNACRQRKSAVRPTQQFLRSLCM